MTPPRPLPREEAGLDVVRRRHRRLLGAGVNCERAEGTVCPRSFPSPTSRREHSYGNMGWQEVPKLAGKQSFQACLCPTRKQTRSPGGGQ